MKTILFWLGSAAWIMISTLAVATIIPAAILLWETNWILVPEKLFEKYQS